MTQRRFSTNGLPVHKANSSAVVRFLLLVSCTASLAHAQTSPTGELEPRPAEEVAGERTAPSHPNPVSPSTGDRPPYGAWTEAEAFAGPRPLFRRSTQGPLVPEPELARSAVELVAGGGPGLAWCFGASALSFPCQGLEPSLVSSLSGLWRVTPFFAWGGRASMRLFTYEPPAAFHARGSGARLVAFEIMGRVYGSSEGLLDPYAELGFGLAALSASVSSRRGGDHAYAAYAPTVHVGGGLDFVLGSAAKLGLVAAVDQVFVPGFRSHDPELVQDDDGYASATLELGARFTLMLGNEL